MPPGLGRTKAGGVCFGAFGSLLLGLFPVAPHSHVTNKEVENHVPLSHRQQYYVGGKMLDLRELLKVFAGSSNNFVDTH